MSSKKEITNSKSISVLKLSLLGTLALLVLISGSHLRAKFQHSDINSEPIEKRGNVTEGSASLGIASPTVTASEKLQEFDNAIIEIASQSSERLIALPNGSTAVKFQEKSVLLSIGRQEIKSSITVASELIDNQSNKQIYSVYNTDPVFSLALLKTSSNNNDIEIPASEIKTGETIIGIQKVPQPAIWISRVIGKKQEAIDQRWFEIIKTTDTPPQEFSGIAVDSVGKLIGIIHQGRILSRNFIRYWIKRAGGESSPGFAVIPASLSPTDNSLNKYLNIKGLEIGSVFNPTTLQQGDILLQINGQQITSNTELAQILSNLYVGQTVLVTLLRNNEKTEEPVYLIDSRILLFTLKPSQIDFKDYLNIQLLKKGQLILENVDKDNPLFNLGLKNGDEIISINNQLPLNLKNLQTIVSSSQGALLLRIARQDKTHWIAIPKEIFTIQ